MSSTYAVVTGASQGIGKEIAISLAKRGYNILLTARSEDKLITLKAAIEQRHHVKADYLVLDLSLSESPGKLAEWVRENHYPVSILANNAGYGLWGRFDELGLTDQLNMIDLNIRALTEITYRFVPLLREQKKSYILNVGSTAAYQAVPTLGAYSATKAYVLSFSRALRTELKPLGITVTALNPGPSDTGFTSRAGMESLQHLAEKFNMPPAVVAEAGVSGLLSGKSEVIPGATNKITAFANRILPKALVEGVAASMYKTK